MKKSDQLSNKDVKTEHFKIAKPYAHLTLLPSSLQLSSSFFDTAFQMRSGSSLWPLHSSLPAVCCSHCFLWCDALLFSSFPHSNPLFKDQCFNPTHNMKNLANYSSLHLFASSCQLLQDILQIPKCSHVLVLFGFLVNRRLLEGFLCFGFCLFWGEMVDGQACPIGGAYRITK